MASTPKGEATRRRILDAAWELSDQRGAEAVLAGVTLREIAAAADVTPSAVGYHFATMDDLAASMVVHLVTSMPPDSVDVIDALVEHALSDGFAAALRMAGQLNWDVITTPDELRFERRLLRSMAAAPADERIRRELAGLVEGWVDRITEIYERAGALLDVGPIEPFELRELARAVSAMTEGLLQFWILDPDAVRRDLLADMAVAVASAVITPVGAPGSLDELSAALQPRSPEHQLASGEVTPEAAHRSAPVFSTGTARVTLTEAARMMGIDARVAAERFGTVERIAALSFGRHLPVVADAAARRWSAGPAVSLTDGVYELARCAASDPHCALALLHERQRSQAAGRSAEECEVRTHVALDPLVCRPLSTLLPAEEARHADELAGLVVDTALGVAATRPRTPPAAVTETALRLVPADF